MSSSHSPPLLNAPMPVPFFVKKPLNFSFPYSAVDLHFTVILKDNQVPNKSSPSTQAVVDVEQTLLRSGWITKGSSLTIVETHIQLII